ncbi:hypothetical protein P8C59_002923 [Phyllachora maydis]|uniref:RNA polymerase II transcription factor B subunit 3 n=1 Tax=Phyllachora maydis TaxID=1825666 RepID=A0AAD9I0D8_9PEZI|nr:hypothetical protein P8C59_002923 [Phyllachora maydis]
MSRKASGGARPAVASASVLSAEDMCPICKTSRYINKDLEFLINPECYHPMCSSCVNRLFNEAPAQCPTAGCNKTLRRKGFRAAFFGDLSVEREVDIRRRVADVFNRKEEDFETLADWNDYLNQVEDLTFDLIHGSDAKRAAAEETLARHEIENKAQIERNRRLGTEANEAARRRLEAELEAKRQRTLQALREAHEERAARARVKEEQLDELATSEASAKVILKKRTKQQLGSAAQHLSGGDGGDAGDWASDVGKLSIRGLKERKRPPPPQGPYDPFGGLSLKPSRYTVHDDLRNPWQDDKRCDSTIITGGYSFEEHTARAMFEAFAGLGVFIEEEKAEAEEKPGIKKEESVDDNGARTATPASQDDVAIKMEIDT